MLFPLELEWVSEIVSCGATGVFEESPHDTMNARHVKTANERAVWRILRTPLVIARFINWIFAVESAWTLDLVVENGLVENPEVAAFVALERNVAEDGACGHVLAVTHGALACRIEVIEVLAVQHDVQPDVSDGKPAAFGEDVFVVGVVIVHHDEFGVPALVEMETVLVVSATATPVEEPSVTACGGNSRVAYAGVGVGNLFVSYETLGLHGGNQLR